MPKVVVNLKSDDKKEPVFTVKGGSERQEFICVDRIIGDQPANTANPGDIIVSIDGTIVAGYTQSDALRLLEKANAEKGFAKLTVISPEDCDKSLKGFLYSTFSPDSFEQTIKDGAFQNLCCYQPIVCNDRRRYRYGENIYRYISQRTLNDLQDNDAIVYLCKDKGVTYGLLVPTAGQTMNLELIERMIENKENMSSILSFFSGHSYLDNNFFRDAVANDLLPLSASFSFDDERCNNLSRREKFFLTRHTVVLTPVNQRFGFELERCHNDPVVRRVVDMDSIFRTHLFVSKIDTVSRVEGLNKIHIRDVLFSADNKNVYQNTDDQMISYIEKQADLERTTRFVFIRVHYYLKRHIKEQNTPDMKIAVNGFSRGRIRNEEASFESLHRNIPSFGFETGERISPTVALAGCCNKKLVSSKNNFIVVKSVDNTLQENQTTIKPGDIIYTVNGMNMVNKDVKFVENYINSCKDEHGGVELDILTELPIDESTLAHLDCVAANTEKRNNISKANPNHENLNCSSHSSSQLLLSITNFMAKTILVKNAFEIFGLIISKNKQSQYIVDGLVSNSIAQQSDKIDIGDVIVAINNIPTRKLSLKKLKHLIDCSENCLQLELHKKPSESHQCVTSSI